MYVYKHDIERERERERLLVYVLGPIASTCRVEASGLGWLCKGLNCNPGNSKEFNGKLKFLPFPGIGVGYFVIHTLKPKQLKRGCGVPPGLGPLSGACAARAWDSLS